MKHKKIEQIKTFTVSFVTTAVFSFLTLSVVTDAPLNAIGLSTTDSTSEGEFSVVFDNSDYSQTALARTDDEFEHPDGCICCC